MSRTYLNPAPGRPPGARFSRGFRWMPAFIRLLAHPASRMRAGRHLALLTAVCLLTNLAAASDEYAVKADYMLTMAEYVEWPADAFSDARAPFVLGIIGDNPFGAELERLKDKKVNGRPLEIRRFNGAKEFSGRLAPGRRQAALDTERRRKLASLKSCHILFVSSSEENFYWSLILRPLGSASVLTVGETASFVEEGGIVNFLKEGNKVGLEISLEAAERARLQISSRLLGLAKVIPSKRGEEDQ